MIDKLTDKDIRALKFGAVGTVVIVLLVFGSAWRDSWAKARREAAALESKLNAIDAGKTRQAALMSIVPTFEMPQVEEEQKFIFRDKLSEQLKKAGIKHAPLQIQTGRKVAEVGYKLLLVKCDATCSFSQLLDFLAGLEENPYLVGIEDLRIKVDSKNRQQIQLNFTVSTFAK